MKTLTLSVLLAVATVIFAVLWRQGAFLKLSAYVDETKEELKKCTWPSRDELWQSTVVVMVACLLLGAFTVGVDFLFASLIRSIL